MSLESILKRAEDAQHQAADPATSAWVSASAGTGKTTVLIQRYLRLLLQQVPADKILCLTFTKTAAAEMKDRLLDETREWSLMEEPALRAALKKLLRSEPSDREMTMAGQLFFRLLDTPDGLKISTIHSFCQSVLARFPVEAGIPPHFRLEENVDEFISQALHHVLYQIEQRPDHPLRPDFNRLVLAFREKRLSAILKEQITGQREKLLTMLARYPDDAAYASALRAAYGMEDISPAAARRRFQERTLPPDLTRLIQQMAEGDAKTYQANAAWMDAWWQSEVSGRSVDEYLKLFVKSSDGEMVQAGSIAGKKLLREFPDLADCLEREIETCRQLIEHERKHTVFEISLSLYRVLREIMDVYHAIKMRRGILDFEDLISHTRRLLAASELNPWVLYKLDSRIEHLLVDEAQDTSPTQWSIIELLMKDFYAGQSLNPHGSLFVVGDRKQSIFSFQGAVPEKFTEFQRHFSVMSEQAHRPFRDVQLNVSFRSTFPVLKLVDETFSQPAVNEGLGEQEITHFLFRQGQAGRIELWPPFASDPTVRTPWQPLTRYLTRPSGIEALCEWTAAHIQHLLASGERLESRDRPVRPRDILILVRTRGQLVATLEQALKRRGIPFAGRDRMKILEHIAAQDLLAFLKFLSLPDDDLNLAALLKSPLCNWSEDLLFSLAAERGDKRLWAALRASQDSAMKPAREFLESSINAVGYRTPYHLLTEALYEKGARRHFIRRFGPGIEEILGQFLDAVLSYEKNHVPTLEGLIAHLGQLDGAIKRETSDTRLNVVRMMTVHGAKGLQAPVVYLPDTLSDPLRSEPLAWDDAPGILTALPAEKEGFDYSRALKAAHKAARLREYNRLLYVALTRAEDRLYIGGALNLKQSADKLSAHRWYTFLQAAMEANGQGQPLSPLAGLEPPGPSAWVLESAQTAEAKQDSEKPEAVIPFTPVPGWISAPAPVERRPEIVSPSHLAGLPGSTLPAAAGLSAFLDQRIHIRRGQALHELLQVLPSILPERRPEAARRILAPYGFPADEAAGYEKEVRRLLDAPHLKFIFDGKAALSEAGLAARWQDRQLQGRIDRLIERDSELWIIDFKTARQPPESWQQVDSAYIRQLSAYQQALTPLFPDRTIRTALLWTATAELMEIPSDALQRQAA